MANFFAEYGGQIGNVASVVPGGWGGALGAVNDYFSQAALAKQQAKEAQRAFELEKLKQQQQANTAATYPGAPSVIQGGTGLAPSIPTWALAGVGLGLVALLLARK